MPLRLNLRGHPTWMGKPLAELPPKEKSVLTLLLRRRPEPVSKEDIIRHAWPARMSVSDESLVRCISQLRQRVPQVSIETVYGFGYKLLPSVQPVHEYLLEVAHAPAEVVEKFMHALGLARKRTAISLARAVHLLRNITDERTDYVHARILLIHSIVLAQTLDLNEHAQVDMQEAWQQLQLIYRQAPDSPVLAAMHARLCDVAWHFDEALRLHREALKGMPGSPYVLEPYIWHLLSTGQAEKSLEHQRRVLAQRPYAVLQHIIWARTLACVDENGAALRAIDETRAANPDNLLAAHAWCSLHAMLKPRPGLVEMARALSQREDTPGFARVSYPYVLARCGQHQQARRELDAALATSRKAGPRPSIHQRMALVPAMIELGDIEGAAGEIDAASQVRYSWLPCMLHSPPFSALREHPVVHEILQAISQPAA